jgi:hypothetical protein
MLKEVSGEFSATFETKKSKFIAHICPYNQFDNILIRLKKEHTKARESIMMHVRKVVPWSLLIAVGTGIYMFINIFGEIGVDGMSSFQTLLSIKAFFGLWLGFRGFNQKFFGINPWVFKSHLFPFILVLIIIFLSQAMFISF